MDGVAFTCLSPSPAQRRKRSAIAKHEPRQNPRPPEPGNEDPGLIEQPKKPSEVESIRPVRDGDLVAGEHAKRPADAMDRNLSTSTLP